MVIQMDTPNYITLYNKKLGIYKDRSNKAWDSQTYTKNSTSLLDIFALIVRKLYRQLYKTVLSIQQCILQALAYHISKYYANTITYYIVL